MVYIKNSYYHCFHRWFHLPPGYEPVAVVPGPRSRVLGPVLAIEAVTEEDGGLYRCSATNAGGEASAELRLIVTKSLQVEVTCIFRRYDTECYV